MDKQPAFYVGVDQFTVVLRFVGQLEDLESWPAQVKRIVDAFVKLSELEMFFGKLVRGRGNRPTNYIEALTYDNVPWQFSIAWHPTQLKQGVCVSFSAHAWAVYQEVFREKHQRQITVAGFLQQIQCEHYSTRLSRIDIMADYFNFGELLKVNTIYSALSTNELVVVDRNNKRNARNIEGREKNYNVQSFTIGSKTENALAKLKVYDKKIEQLAKAEKAFRLDEARACESWTRFEASYRSDYAHQISDDLVELGKLNDTEGFLDTYVQYLASKILDRYRFKDVATGEMTLYTKMLLDLAQDGTFRALRTESPENHSLEHSTTHLCRQSGIMALLYKVEKIWGRDAIAEYLQHIIEYYEKCYCEKAKSNYRLQKWLRENTSSLENLSLVNCFKGLELDFHKGKKKHSKR